MKAQHTQTPWQVNGTNAMQVCDSEENGRGCSPIAYASDCVSKREAVANAEFIVRAVNSHNALVAALQAYVDAFGWDEGPDSIAKLREDARAILKQANAS